MQSRTDQPQITPQRQRDCVVQILPRYIFIPDVGMMSMKTGIKIMITIPSIIILLLYSKHDNITITARYYLLSVAGLKFYLDR